MGFIEQLSAVAILADFLFGIAVGLVLTVSCASRREDRQYSLRAGAPDPLCDGVRVFQGVYTRGGQRPAAHRAGPGGAAQGNPGGRDPDEWRTDPER